MPMKPLVIEAAPGTPDAMFNLLDTIGVQPLPTEGIGGGVTYPTDFCGTAQPWAAPCVDPGGDPKTADDGIDFTTGAPVTIYHLFTCRLIGEGDDGLARARRSLDLGASRAVEEGFAAIIGDGAIDLNGPFDIVRAIAEMEQYAGANYGGRPVIHLTRRAATMAIAADVVMRVGDHLETGLGSLVVAGAGYDASQEPAAPTSGSEWGYVTGAVNIWEAEVEARPLVMARGASGGYNNEFAALAERVYVPTFECFSAAVEIQIEVP